MRSVFQLVLFAQLSLICFLLVCVALIPHFLFQADEGGVSNYGTYAKTIIPYTLGFGLCSLLTLRAAYLLPVRSPLRRPLYVLGVVYMLELLSTYSYKLGSAFDTVHIYVSAVGAVYALALGIWLALRIARNRVNIMLLCVLVIGFVVATLTYLGYLHVLFIAEMLTSTAFGILLVRVVGTVTQKAPSKR